VRQFFRACSIYVSFRARSPENDERCVIAGIELLLSKPAPTMGEKRIGPKWQEIYKKNCENCEREETAEREKCHQRLLSLTRQLASGWMILLINFNGLRPQQLNRR
jgi:hypothetical protein